MNKIMKRLIITFSLFAFLFMAMVPVTIYARDYCYEIPGDVHVTVPGLVNTAIPGGQMAWTAYQIDGGITFYMDPK